MSTTYDHPVTDRYAGGRRGHHRRRLPGDNRCRCYQPPQAGPGVTKLARVAPGCVVGRARPGWAVAGRGRRRQALPMEGLRGLRGGGGWVAGCPRGGTRTPV